MFGGFKIDILPVFRDPVKNTPLTRESAASIEPAWPVPRTT